jgi:hypothetical protein
MFAKNKPTKIVTFEDGKYSITLQHLPKGIKDDYNSRLAELSLGLKGISKEVLEKIEENMDKIPDSMAAIVGKINQLEYFKLANAIREWSEKEVPITEETVKELDEDVFNELVKEVDKMNGLTVEQRKN